MKDGQAARRRRGEGGALPDAPHRPWPVHYVLPSDVAFEVQALARGGGVEVVDIGEAVDGQRLQVLKLGRGDKHLAAVGNAHADEPSGTVTCLQYARRLLRLRERMPQVLEKFTFHLLPTINPAGLVRNRGWLRGETVDLLTWARHVHRDSPQEDREFGYGETPEQARHPECAAWHRYLDGLPRLDGYLSLHSMAFGGGAWYLVMGDREPPWRWNLLLGLLGFTAHHHGLPLHDEDRGGRKGFSRIGPGFHTAPTREGMQAFFEKTGQPGAGDWLRLNSMQVVRQRHHTPFCLVSELPQWWDPELADMTELDTPRRDVDRRRGAALLATLRELEQLDGDGELAEVIAHRRGTAEGFIAAADDWGEARAHHRDLAASDLQVLRCWVENAVLALRADAAADRAPDDRWVGRLLRRIERLEQRFELRPLPLSEQVVLQMQMIDTLAAVASAEGLAPGVAPAAVLEESP